MRKFEHLALSAVCAFGMCLVTSAGEYFAHEEQVDWFGENVSGYTVGGALADVVSENGRWAVPESADVAIGGTAGNAYVDLAAEVSDPLVYSNTTQPESGYGYQYLTVRFQALANVDEAEMPQGAQGSLTVISNSTQKTIAWYGQVGSSWVKLQGEVVNGAWYDARLEFDYGETRRVRYSVKPVSSDTYTVLKADGAAAEDTGWFVNGSSATTINAVAFAGESKFKDFATKVVFEQALPAVTISDVSSAIALDCTSATLTLRAEVASSTACDNVDVSVTYTNAEKQEVTVTKQAATGTTTDLAFDLAGLAEGGSYTVSIKSNGELADETTATVTATLLESWIGSNSAGDVGGEWNETLAWTDGVAEVSDAVFAITGDKSREAASKLVTVDTTVSLDGAIAASDLEIEAGMQAAVALVESDGETAWWGVVNGEWVALTGGATDEGDYVIRAEFDYRLEEPKVRYSVKPVSGESFVVLTREDAEWLAMAGSANQLNAVKLAGSTTLSSLVGGYIDDEKSLLVPVEIGSVAIEQGWIKGATGYDLANDRERAVASLKTTGRNGVEVWQSYVLGLNPADENAKPITKSVDTDKTDKIAFVMANLGASKAAEAGVSVKYVMKSFTAPTGGESVETSDLTDIGSAVEMGLPASGATYYKAEIQISK